MHRLVHLPPRPWKLSLPSSDLPHSWLGWQIQAASTAGAAWAAVLATPPGQGWYPPGLWGVDAPPPPPPQNTHTWTKTSWWWKRLFSSVLYSSTDSSAPHLDLRTRSLMYASAGPGRAGSLFACAHPEAHPEGRLSEQACPTLKYGVRSAALLDVLAQRAGNSLTPLG